jgi:hypothetical protein
MTLKEMVFKILDEHIELRQIGTLELVWSKVMDTQPKANIISVDRYIRMYRSRRPDLNQFFNAYASKGDE